MANMVALLGVWGVGLALLAGVVRLGARSSQRHSRREMSDRLLKERAFSVAWRWTRTFVTWLFGLPLLVLTAGLSLWVALISNTRRPIWERVMIGAAQVFVLVVVVLILVLLVCWIFSPRSQRNEVRERLRRIDRVRKQYRLVSTGCDLLPHRSTGRPDDFPAEFGDLIRFQIRNEGRAARFAVLVESLEGTDQISLVHQYAPLHWMGRNDALAEEIARGEGRTIGIGYLLPGGVDGAIPYRMLVFQGPSGTRYNTEYRVYEAKPVRVRFAVSARGVPDIGFSQPFELNIYWIGDSPIQITRPDPDPLPRRYPYQDSIGELFDFS